MVKRLALVVFVVGALAAPSASWARTVAASASGVLAPVSGQKNTYTLKVTNTGDQPLQCMRFTTASGVEISSVDQASGSNVTSTATTFAGTLNLAPGQSITWTFHTTGTYPSSGINSLAVSPNCAPGSDVTSAVPAPVSTTNPVTTVTACQCQQITVSIKPEDVYTASAQLSYSRDGLARIGALVNWTMTCSAGAGNCNGSITVVKPDGDVKPVVSAATSFVPKTGPYKGKTLYKKGKPGKPTIECKGPCTASVHGTFFLQLDSTKDLLTENRGGKTITVSFKITCPDAKTLDVKFAFDGHGRLDKKKSAFSDRS